MPNHMKFCGCRRCRSGMHCTRRGKSAVRRAARKLRRGARVSLRREAEPPRVVSVPYTD